MERCQGCDRPFAEGTYDPNVGPTAGRMILTGGPALGLCEACFHAALAWAARGARKDARDQEDAMQHDPRGTP